MKRKVLLDTVDYHRYCGGWLISKGYRYITVERFSNYQGSRSGEKWRSPLERGVEIVKKINVENPHVDGVIEELLENPYYGFEKIKKGSVVY